MTETTAWSGLVPLLKSIKPAGRYGTCDMPQADIDTIGTHAENAAISLTLGLAVVGKMMTVPDGAKELSPDDIMSLGDLIATLSEAAHELNELGRWASITTTSEVGADA